METMHKDGAYDLVSNHSVREDSKEHHGNEGHHSTGHSRKHAPDNSSATIDESGLEESTRHGKHTQYVLSHAEMPAKHAHEDEHVGSSNECVGPSGLNEKHIHNTKHGDSSRENIDTHVQYDRHDHETQHKDAHHDSGESHIGRHEQVSHQSKSTDVTHSRDDRHEKLGEREEEILAIHIKQEHPPENNELKATISDEHPSRNRSQISRRSTPDIDPSTQRMRHATFNSRKFSRSGLKTTGNLDLYPGSADANLETPSTSWAFSVRASIAPSKFDHMATLKTMYISYKECSNGKEGVPLSLLPEILESARFMVPPPRDLVPLLQKINIGYKSGDLVKWTLLQSLAMQIERKEARYPCVFNPRFRSYAMCNVVRANSISPNSGKMLRRSPSRRTHPEDACPEMEPEVYQMMKQIDNHRRKSAKEGNYLAADAAAQRLLELKIFEDSKRRATMLERHAQEREQAEKAYKDELQERNQLWDERLKSFQKEVMDQAQRLKLQHSTAVQQFRDKMALKMPVKAQWSRELLKQRQIQAYLGKQGKYLEAQEVKQSADRMEQAELQAAVGAFQADIVGKEQCLRMKQQTEMDVLLQRAARTREEIRKNRTLDLQRCHQRHKNVMRELTAIQKQEVFRFDQLMQKKVHNPKTGIGLKNQRNSYYSLRGQMKTPDYSTDDAIYSAGED